MNKFNELLNELKKLEIIQEVGGLEEKHLIFLDNLRESGVTNMYGASPYLQRKYPSLSREDARAILSYWMKTFGERHSNE